MEASEGAATEGQPILKESGCRARRYPSCRATPQPAKQAHTRLVPLCMCTRVRGVHNYMCICTCVHVRVRPSLGLCGAERVVQGVTEDGTRVHGLFVLGCTPTCAGTSLGRCCLPGCVWASHVHARVSWAMGLAILEPPRQ